MYKLDIRPSHEMFGLLLNWLLSNDKPYLNYQEILIFTRYISSQV